MTADLFHYGHVEFLKQARALGDYVLVGIHSDVVLEAHKRKPVLTMEERVTSVAACRWVDEVISKVDRIDPLECRRYVEHHFSSRAIA